MNRDVLYLLLVLSGVGLNFFRQRLWNRPWNSWLFLGLPALAMVWFLLEVTDCPWFRDFKAAYYPAGKLVLESPSRLYYAHICVVGFVNIPIVALLFLPFSQLRYSIAVTAFTVLGTAFVVAACYAILRLTEARGWRRSALIGSFAVNGPLIYSMKEGNSTHFFLLVLLFLFVLTEKKRDFVVGSLIAVSALIKIPIGLLGIYFLFRRRWRVVAGLGVTLTVVAAASVWMFGVAPHLAWIQRCVGPYVGKPMAAFNVQSADGFLARLMTDGNVLNWIPLDVGLDFHVARYALIGSLLLPVLVILWSSGPPRTIREEYLELSIMIPTLLTVFPVSWTHYYLLMLLPFGLYLGNKIDFPDGKAWHACMCLTFLAVSLPVLRVQPADPVLEYLLFKFLYSHYFLGGCAALGLLLAARLRSFQNAPGTSSRRGSSAATVS